MSCLATWYENRNYLMYSNAVRGDRDMATSNICKKIGEDRPCSFRVMQVDRQTNRQQTDILITILCTPPRGELIRNKLKI